MRSCPDTDIDPTTFFFLLFGAPDQNSRMFGFHTCMSRFGISH